MFLKFLKEIRNRCFLLAIMWFITLMTIYFYKEIILFKIVQPYALFIKSNSFYFISTSITEIFSTYLRLCFFFTNQTLFIFAIYHILIFTIPGLYKRESKIIKNLFCLNIIFNFFALTMLNKIILPFSCNFFLKFQNSFDFNSLNFYFEAKINEYLSFYIKTYIFYFLNLQFFFLINVLIKYFLKNLKIVKTLRKKFYFIFCIIATIMTPPDVLSQLIVFFSLVSMYEITTFKSILKIRYNRIQ